MLLKDETQLSLVEVPPFAKRQRIPLLPIDTSSPAQRERVRLENKYREVFEQRMDWRRLVTCESKKGSMRMNCRMAALFHVEFISEITLAFLHGPKNKKANLEKTYQLYETKFDEAANVEDVFLKVLGELAQILPNLRTTRWRKKSDFYTLFLVLVFGAHVARLPVTAEKRNKARDILLEFSSDVDVAVTTNVPGRKRLSNSVARYANAVERSASDLASRRTRTEMLEELLKAIFAQG